jgi:hypothetical protein
VLAAPDVVLGDRLGLYKALAATGPATPAELAARTGTHERYVTEWLRGQASGGYVTYDPDADRYLLSEEQAFTLADETSPAFLAGAFQLATSTAVDQPKIAEAFRTGEGVGWDRHHPDLFEGTERFFRPGYVANLVDSWIPALDGVQEKLEAGARVADVGCGHGASTILMAAAWPRSSFVGFDYHRPSIERARKAAADAGVGDRCSFEVAAAADYPGEGYDLVAVFDALHDLGDPVGAAAHVRRSLAPDGTFLLGGAGRRRAGGGQPQPGRAHLLLGVDADLRAQRPVPGRAGARQSGAGGAAAGAARAGRLRQGAPRRRDAVQPRAGGAPVAARAASRSAAHSFHPSASSGASSRRGARAWSWW